MLHCDTALLASHIASEPFMLPFSPNVLRCHNLVFCHDYVSEFAFQWLSHFLDMTATVYGMVVKLNIVDRYYDVL